MTKYIPTAERVEVKEYPYGFRLKTTLTDFIEFDPKKGYRHCTQTIDPRNGRVNKPKKSTYHPLLVRFYDEKGHIKTLGFDFNGDKALNSACKFIAANFDIFTSDEIKYLYSVVYSMAILDYKATCIYGGSDPEILKQFYTGFWATAKDGLKNGGNLFASLVLDNDGIEATKPKDFNPFQVKTYTTN